jgi:flagellar protein FliL
MADESDDDAAAAAKKKKKKMIIGGLVVAGLAYQFVLKPSPPVEDPAAAEAEEVIEEGEVATIEELVVNLADRDEVHYLRVGVGVVLEAGIAVADIEPELAKINDVVIDIVSTKTFDELRGPGATAALKDQISEAARAAFDDERVVRIIFTSFVMQ